MKKRAFIIVLIFLSSQISAQSNWEKFWKLSCTHKKWVVFHPFKAKKASEKEISGEKKKLFGQSTVNDFMGWYTILSFEKKTKTELGKKNGTSFRNKKKSLKTPIFLWLGRYFG